MTSVTITENPLALEDLLAIVDGAQVTLSDGARGAIAASREVGRTRPRQPVRGVRVDDASRARQGHPPDGGGNPG
jgi:hypothetical protein